MFKPKKRDSTEKQNPGNDADCQQA